MKNYTGFLTKEKVYEICDNFEKYRLIAGLKVKVISSNDQLWDGYAEGIKASKNWFLKRQPHLSVAVLKKTLYNIDVKWNIRVKPRRVNDEKER